MDYSYLNNAPVISGLPKPTKDKDGDLKAPTPYDLKRVSQYAMFAAYILKGFINESAMQTYISNCFRDCEDLDDIVEDIAQYLLPYADSFWQRLKEEDVPFLCSDIGGLE